MLGKILIVEDDPLWQEFLQEPLADEYALTVVSNRGEAKEALDRAQAAGEPFRVVTVDIGLDRQVPSLQGGEDILAFVRQHHRGTKCIVVTGHQSVSTTRLRDYFKQFEVFDYIGKADFDLARFKQIVDKVFYFHGYRLLAELGRGGMGTVYKALDLANDQRIVALKVLHQDPRLLPDDLARHLARFNQEVETIRRLAHPNIVTLYDYVTVEEPESQVFFVMEYLPGPTLEAMLATGQKLSLAEVRRVGRQLCAALGYAHAQQVIHRDVKPSNIMMLPEGQLKITDFGIAKTLNRNLALTRTEEIVGTLDYMPPEQILHTKEVDYRVDIYATGAVLYEMLSGQKPYPDPLLKLQEDPLPLSQLTPGLPEGLSQVIMKALARAPQQRYQTAGELAEALEQGSRVAR